MTLHTSAKPTILWYRFIVRDGTTTAYVEDDPPADGGRSEATTVARAWSTPASIDASWQIDVYDPAFTTPDWAQGAVAYQIFPDRFFNGDPSNDPSPEADAGRRTARASIAMATSTATRCSPKAWGDLPEGYCRAYQARNLLRGSART